MALGGPRSGHGWRGWGPDHRGQDPGGLGRHRTHDAARGARDLTVGRGRRRKGGAAVALLKSDGGWIRGGRGVVRGAPRVRRGQHGPLEA